MHDYYAILELDPGASPESIKIAYRRLARENHPDHKTSVAEAEQLAAAERMAKLNEAYAVLSDARQRREYDEKLRTLEALTSLESRDTVEAAKEARPAASVRPGAEVNSSVVGEFSNHIRTKLLSSRRSFRWQDKKLEGFDWALEARYWSASYCVALRSFGSANLAAAKKFTNYAELAMAHCRRYFGKGYFLFLLPFQRLSDTEQVSAHCRQFAKANRATSLSGTQTMILLLDVLHGRSLSCGLQIRDGRFEQLSDLLAISRR